MSKQRKNFKLVDAPASHPIYQSGIVVGWPISSQKPTSGPGADSKPSDQKPEDEEGKESSPQP